VFASSCAIATYGASFWLVEVEACVLVVRGGITLYEWIGGFVWGGVSPDGFEGGGGLEGKWEQTNVSWYFSDLSPLTYMGG